MQKIIVAYYLALNLFLFATMYSDKRRAIKNHRRIPERTLLFSGLLGGFLGGLLGMRFFKHKTKKNYFWLTYFAALLLHIFILVYFLL